MTEPNRAAEALKRLLSGSQLPALPQSALRILELSEDPNCGPAELAIPLESDPGLASQILRFANSSYFGFSREIATVKLAIVMLGVRTIKNFALWSAVFSSVPDPRCGPYDLKFAWCDSLLRAVFARCFTKLRQAGDADETFAAALL